MNAAAATPANMPSAIENMMTRLLTLFRHMFRHDIEKIMIISFNG
jgi:hypothetical protein